MGQSAISFAKLKLVRIAEHIDAINRHIETLTRSIDAYEITSDDDGKETLHFLVPPPPEVQIIAGEIVYQFKSILDQLAFALVESNPRRIKLPKGWDRECQFPLLLSVPTCGKPPITYPIPVPKGFFENKLPGISEAAYTFIEGVQPYRTGAGVHNILRIIGRLANIDKHRHPYVLVRRAQIHHHFTCSDGFHHMSTVGGYNHGAEIPLFEGIVGEAPVDMYRTITPYITFDETVGAGPDTLDTENVLQACLQQFESGIIPAFDKFIQ